MSHFVVPLIEPVTIELDLSRTTMTRADEQVSAAAARGAARSDVEARRAETRRRCITSAAMITRRASVTTP